MTTPEDPHPAEGATWNGLVLVVQAELERSGSLNAASEARWMVEEASGLSGSEWIELACESSTRLARASVARMLDRRLCGEPLQYVLGSWQFRTIELFLDRRVLIPRPETEQLVEYALAEVDRLAESDSYGPQRNWLNVVDLGTGSGAIALSMASEREKLNVYATDLSPAALDVARSNLAGIGRHATRVALHEGSWFSALPDQLKGDVHVAVSNPPYVSEAQFEDLPDEVGAWEPRSALVSGPTGLEAIEEVVSAAAEWLSPGGALLVEIGETQADQAIDLALGVGLVEVQVHDDLSGKPRVLIARTTVSS